MTTTEPSDKRVPKRPRHVARSARILSTGISATAILGMTAAFGAAEKLQASQNPTPPQPTPNAANTPSALSPLGTIGTAPVHTTQSSVTQYPSTEGTVTLPTGAPVQTVRDSVPQAAVDLAAPAATATTPVADTVVDMITTTVVDSPVNVAAAEAPTAAIAPIAPAEPPVQFTLPPAPSRGSSGGSR